MDKRQTLQEAVALAYETGDFAPKVLAKGRGAIAEHIIALAKEQGVFVHESKDLVSMLMQVDLDDHIPAELYQAIAEILAWLYRLESGEPVAALTDVALV
jgi:flagellar biosynthesis protein